MTKKKEVDKKDKTIQKKDQVGQLREELEKTRKKCEENLNGWKRAQADYQNIQKSVAKERESLRRFVLHEVLHQIIPLYNNFELAAKHMPSDLTKNEWATGIMHIKNQFENILSDMGVERIETNAKQFDPRYHEAVSQEEQESKESGTIIKEVSPGYTLNEEVIIPAKVVVVE